MYHKLNNVFYRTLAVVLAIALVLSVAPFSMTASAATDSYPNSVTVTVTDENGTPIAGAAVHIIIATVNDYKYENDVVTNASGVAEVLNAAQYESAAQNGSLMVQLDAVKEGYFSSTLISNIVSATDNFTVVIVKHGIELTALNGEYTGEPQELVKVEAAQGDTITYTLGDVSMDTVPVGTEVGEYLVGVTVKRIVMIDGQSYEKNFSTTVKATINKLTLDIALVAKTDMEYTGKAQALVEVTGADADLLNEESGAEVVWTVNTIQESGRAVPERTAAGEYTVSLKVAYDTAHYEEYTQQVPVKIACAVFDEQLAAFEDLNITFADKRVYNGTVQNAVKSVVNNGGYTLKYAMTYNTEVTPEETAFTEDYKTLKTQNAGNYTVHVYVSKENYQSKVYKNTVVVEKASQQLMFDETLPDDTADLSQKTYAFSASSNVQDVSVKYTVASDPAGIAFISEDGVLTVDAAGVILVTAAFGESVNYAAGEISHMFIMNPVPDAKTVWFKNDTVSYTWKDNGSIPYQVAQTDTQDEGVRTYSLERNDIGLSINKNTGEIAITDAMALAEAMGTSKITVTVFVHKAEDTYTSKRFGTTRFFAEDTASYKLTISYAAFSEGETVNVKVVNEPKNGWYNIGNEARITFTNPQLFNTYAMAVDSFGDFYAFEVTETKNEETGETTITGNYEVTSTRSGTKHKVFLKNRNTQEILPPITLNFNADYSAPEVTLIEYSKSLEELPNWLENIVVKFYNPSVTVTFTATDAPSGVATFDWGYYAVDRNDNGSGDVAESGTLDNIQYADGVYTASMTLTAEQAKQYRGHICARATDVAGNVKNEWKTDTDHIVVVDTIAPELEITYSGAKNMADDNKAYYNGDIAATITVKETNFFTSDIVTVTVDDLSTEELEKNKIDVSWGTSEDTDVYIGTFTLTGDGHYAVHVNAEDKSGNKSAPYVSHELTIDTKKPVVRKTEFMRDEAKNLQRLTIEVDEHNFDAKGITLGDESTVKNIVGDEVENGLSDLLAILQDQVNWSKAENSDIYTIVIDDLKDAIYNVDIVCEDLATNKGSKSPDPFSVDKTGPANPTITIEKDNFVQTVLEVVSLGFYNAPVTVTFSAEDNTTGVDAFYWAYVQQEGTSGTNLPSNEIDPNKKFPNKVDATQVYENEVATNIFTAKITFPGDEEQIRGHLMMQATDGYDNESDIVETYDTDNKRRRVIVVDTIDPTVSVEYSEAANYLSNDPLNPADDQAYYNGDIKATITVVETNFFEDIVSVTVDDPRTQVNEEMKPVVEWIDGENDDEHIGTFTLTGDGHYVVNVTAEDKSGNEAVPYTSHELTIDTVAPIVDVVYQNTEVINTLPDINGNERKYLDNTQTAVVTVHEHNFDAALVDFTLLAADVSGNVLEDDETTDPVLYQMTDWASNGDVHMITITYPGDANYTFDVECTDLATNASAEYATDYFTVDKTAPANLSVSYSQSVLETMINTVSFGFYNAKMRVTLSATDDTAMVNSFVYSYVKAAGVSAVNAQLIEQAIAEAGIAYSADYRTATVTFEIPRDALTNNTQFNGNVEFTVSDRSGNKTALHKESKRIVVDNIAPTAEVSFNQPVNTEGEISYYDGNINVTITVNEANFYAEDVRVMVAKDEGGATAMTPTWSDQSADVHVGTFTLTEDGDYFITIDYTDKSTNKMVTYTSKQLTIDTEIQPPTFSINGVAKTEEGGAYNGDARVGFEYTDENFDTKTITLTKTRFDEVVDVTEQFISVVDGEKGATGSFELPVEELNDGIYLLKITMTDKAKHSTEAQMKFTINRFGSVYEYNDALVQLIKKQYVQSVDAPLVITEYNANALVPGSTKVLVTRDGQNVETNCVPTPHSVDGQVAPEAGGWYRYEYKLDAKTFAEDGVYKIALTSMYETAESNANESTSVPENSVSETGEQVLDAMNFTVDSTAPEIRNIVNLDKKIADKDKIEDGKLNVKYTIVDVGGLQSVKVTVNGVVIQTYEGESIADNAYNFTGNFDLAEQKDKYKVAIEVTDLAGNVTNTATDEFRNAHSAENQESVFVFFDEIIVSRNFFIRWYANTVLFWSSIGGGVVIAALALIVVATKRKKKES